MQLGNSSSSSRFKKPNNCTQCQYSTLLEDASTVHRKLQLLDRMHLQKKQLTKQTTKQATQDRQSHKLRQLNRKLTHFSKQIEMNSRESQDLVTQAKLMLKVRSAEKLDSASLLFSMETPNNFSSVQSLQRYISQGETEGEIGGDSSMNPSSNTLNTQNFTNESLEQLTDRFNGLMMQLQNDKSLSDTHVREQLLDVASRIKEQKNRILHRNY